MEPVPPNLHQSTDNCAGTGSKTFHSRFAGFTLVEVLTTTLIVAILAVVAIPVYSGYVTRQRQDMVKNLAATGAVSANLWYRRHNSPPDSARLGLFLTDPSRYSVRVENGWVIITDISVSPPVRDSARYN